MFANISLRFIVHPMNDSICLNKSITFFKLTLGFNYQFFILILHFFRNCFGHEVLYY